MRRAWLLCALQQRACAAWRTGDLKYLLVPFYLAEARRQSALAACVTTAVLLLCGDGAGAGADARIAALLRAAAGAVAR